MKTDIGNSPCSSNPATYTGAYKRPSTWATSRNQQVETWTLGDKTQAEVKVTTTLIGGKRDREREIYVDSNFVGTAWVKAPYVYGFEPVTDAKHEVEAFEAPRLKDIKRIIAKSVTTGKPTYTPNECPEDLDDNAWGIWLRNTGRR